MARFRLASERLARSYVHAEMPSYKKMASPGPRLNRMIREALQASLPASWDVQRDYLAGSIRTIGLLRRGPFGQKLSFYNVEP
jgi:hypothetical protein